MHHATTRRLALALLLLATTAAGAAETETTDRTYRFSPTGEVVIENVNGRIDVQGWDRPELRLRVVKTAATAEELRAIEVDVDASPDRIVIATRHRAGGWSWKRLTAGLFGGGERSVSYSVRVPRGARLEKVESINGPVTVDGVTGAVAVTTVNGSVRATGVGGAVELETVNGSLFAALATAGAGDRVTASAVNGSVVVELPAGADVVVAAETVNGRIATNCGLDVVEHRFVGRELHGTLGAGDGRVEVETVNGRIEIRVR